MRSEADAVRFAEITASELSGIGINMDMAPVLDVVPDTGGSVMASRAFGNDPGWVSRLGTAVIRNLQQNHIMAVAKHFPGIGRTTLDSHDDLPTVAADRTTLSRTDLVPFRSAIENNVAGMMLSHIMYDQIDNQWPASLSTRVANDLLRKTMGYTGVVITDDLDMGAIQKHYDIHTIMRQILTAEIDIALICHSFDQMKTAFRLSLDFLERSPSNLESGIRSVRRILALKQRYLGT
jgi:beta-N-acetylhexosaminidase